MASNDQPPADLRRRPFRGGRNAPPAVVVAIPDLVVESFPGEFGNRSYIVRASNQTAFVVDPPRDVDAHVRWATERGLRIAAVLETHVAGDGISGARELATATGATIVAPEAAALQYEHRPVTDGWVVLIGDVEVHAIATPGHTPEHMAYIVVVDGTPAAVFTGGLLASPAPLDEMDGEDDPGTDDPEGGTLDLATATFDLRRRSPDRFPLARVPGSTPTYPTHPGADDIATTLLALDAAPFAAGPADPLPAHAASVRARNRQGATLRTAAAEPVALDPGDAARLARAGTWLIDIRPAQAWVAGHAPQAIAVPSGPMLRRLLAHVVPPGAPVVVMGDEAQLAQLWPAAAACGHDGIIGWVAGGWRAWREAGLILRTTPVASTHNSVWADALGSPSPPVLAVGNDIGFAALASGAGPAPGHEVIVTAATDAEAVAAASLLEARGVRVAVRLPA